MNKNFKYYSPARSGLLKPGLNLIVFILVFFIMQTGYSINDKQDKKIYLVFRFDDYSAKSNTRLELDIIETFRKNNMAFTIGVIPFIGAGNLLDPTPQENIPLGEEKGDILKNASKQGIVEVALHGYSHQSHSAEYIGSEFKGLAVEQQKDKIIKGRKYLEKVSDTAITTFVPPWNHYDANTLKVLDELEFGNLSADMFGKGNKTTAIQFLPNSCGLLELKGAIKAARESSDTESIIVALFHEYDFIESNNNDGILDFEVFSELIEWVDEQTDVTVFTIDQMTSHVSKDYLIDKFRVNQKINAWSFKIPPFIPESYSYVYASEKYLQSIQLKVISIYLIILALSMVITYLLIKLLKLRTNRKLGILLILNFALFGVLVLYAIYNEQLGYKLSILITITIGLTLSILISFLINRRHKPINA
jgi:peptidoglycan/xylan/chitin deacetylase (PgdA/CDA1 family)